MRPRAAGSLVLLLLIALPLPALAAKLVEVRVGRHTGYTRVVLQTDAPVDYSLTRSKSGNLRVTLEADASPRRLVSKSDVLREVIVEDTGDAALARLKLHRTDVAVKEMVLTGPPRIVLDLTPGVPQPPLAAAEPAAAAPKPAEAAPTETKQTATEPTAAAEPAKETPDASAKDASDADAEPEPTAVAAAATTTASAGGRLADSKVDPRPTSDPAPKSAEAKRPAAKETDVAAGDTDADAPEAETAGAGDAPADEPVSSGIAKVDPSKERPKQKERPKKLREMPKAPPARADPPPTPSAQEIAGTPGALSFLPVPFDDPLVLGGVGGLLVLIAALVAVRRRGAVRADDDYDSPFAPPDPDAPAAAESASDSPIAAAFDVSAPAGEAAPPAESDLPAMPGQPVPEPSDGFGQGTGGFEEGDSLFAGETEAEEEKEAEASVFPPVSAAAIGASETPAPGGDVMRVVEELERRMGQMETRLEEVMDAKERLERQVSAQTEELRVQRAAIARTQRVLRNVSRPEDEATEPAPKV